MDNLLAGLFVDDHGDVAPSWVNCFQARSMVNGKINELGYAYLWAQRLAGLDFNGVLKTTSQSFINTEFVETVLFLILLLLTKNKMYLLSQVILALKNRIDYRFQFDKVLHLLGKYFFLNWQAHWKLLPRFHVFTEKGELNLNQDSDAAFPSAICSRLLHFATASYEECITSKHLEQLLNFLGTNPKSVTFFKATLERQSGIIFKYPSCHT